MQTQFTLLIFWLIFLVSFQASASETSVFPSTAEPQSTITVSDPNPKINNALYEYELAPADQDALEQGAEMLPVYRITQTVDDQGQVTTDGFDGQDRLIMRLLPDKTVAIRTYLEDGSYEVSSAAPSGQITHFDYDAQGKLVSVYSVLSAGSIELPPMEVVGQPSPAPSPTYGDFVTQTYYGVNSNTSVQVAGVGGFIRGLFGKAVGKGGSQTIKSGTSTAVKATGGGKVRTGAKALGYNQNKIDHVFQAKHKLGPLVQQYGNKNNALAEIHKAAQSVAANYQNGTWVTINVGGTQVFVKGAVVNGVFKIGTASMRPFY